MMQPQKLNTFDEEELTTPTPTFRSIIGTYPYFAADSAT
jgi:hypothetical protein